VPAFLSQPPTALYLVLAVGFVIALAVWYRRRDKKSLLAMSGFGAILLGIYLVDRSAESPREQANRRAQAMAEAATAQDRARFLEQLSDSFNYNGANKEKMRTSGMWDLIRNYNARIAVWGFGTPDYVEHGENEIEIGFYVKGESPGHLPLTRFIRARFVRDPDGQFRAKTVKFYSTDGGLNREDPPPGFP
jgi:ABC-type nickel/cobalt efflux system permease component RcnA